MTTDPDRPPGEAAPLAAPCQADEAHPWRIIADDRRLIQWCPQCGTLRVEAKQKHEGVHTTVTYPATLAIAARTAPLAEERLAALEALFPLMTPGPWTAMPTNDGYIRSDRRRGYWVDPVVPVEMDNRHDAFFVAEVREVVPSLLAEVRALRVAAASTAALVAAARAWCHTYAVRELTAEESALMTAVAAWEEGD